MILRLRFLSILIGAAVVGFSECVLAQADILGVEVEMYYISDENDETDTDGGLPLPAGSKTYRVYLQLAEGAKLRSIYGDINHQLKIESTAVFFNNEDRGQLFGHQIQNNRLGDNTVALDSWLSFGAASNAHYGVLKTEDTNGSVVGGINNDGGSENIPGGLLANDDPQAGIPLTVQDGLVPGTSLTPENFTVLGDSPENAFGEVSMDSSFVSNSFNAFSINGVSGPTDQNNILIAQLTTTGELSFELNVEVINNEGVVYKYVAQNSGQGTNETASPWLSYPPQCGCTDPDYVEFDPIAGCDNGSCSTLVQFGCTDVSACNYDSEANFNIPGLCCYGPDNCNGLDISIVCPTLSTEEPSGREKLMVYPNPTNEAITIQLSSALPGTYDLSIFDLTGKLHISQNVEGGVEGINASLVLSTVPSGTYLLRISNANFHMHSLIVKN